MTKGLKMRGNLIAALDLGTTKCVCFIARVQGGQNLRVIGIGHQESRGLRNGAIVDMEAAEAAILNAVHTAEQTAGETLRHLIVNVSGGHPLSHRISTDVAVSGTEVGDADIRRALSQGRTQFAPNGRRMLHFIPLSYRVDGSRGVRDPRGMAGGRLGVDMHVVTAEAGPLRNLVTCISRAHLDVGSLVVSPYASGLACLVEDETDLGVTLIDMGGGTTSIAVFYDGSVVHTDCLPVGGAHVTNDIARGLSTPVNHAERLKTLHGSCLPSANDQREILTVPPIGDENPNHAQHVPKSYLVGIIQPRLEETFEMIKARLEASGFDRIAGRRVVLTGGASQLQGVRDMAASFLDKQVRMARPSGIVGLSESTSGPAFSTAAGLLQYALLERTEGLHRGLQGGFQAAEPAHGVLGRVGSWLRDRL